MRHPSAAKIPHEHAVGSESQIQQLLDSLCPFPLAGALARLPIENTFNTGSLDASLDPLILVPSFLFGDVSSSNEVLELGGTCLLAIAEREGAMFTAVTSGDRVCVW